MRIAGRLLTGALLALGLMTGQAHASDGVLQCVPYARAISGIAIHGDAWTWWDQARGRYARGTQPRPGAVIALANTAVMPLGHVAVVSQIVDARHILLRHANWSGPGRIEIDVMAVDSSPDNDWSQVRIWWGQSGQMGARDNPVNGFIYPERPGDFAPYDREETARPMLVADMGAPRLALDPALFTRRDMGVTQGTSVPTRTLAMIVGEVKRDARLR